MSNQVNRALVFRRRGSSLLVLPLLIFALVTPATVSCQRAGSDPDAGIEELRALVRTAAGKPAVADLSRIESRFSRTRAASLARFLRGYLYYASQNYQAAVDALDARAVSSNTSIGDYAFFYRAESEASTDAKNNARNDYRVVPSKYADSLKSRESTLRAAEVAV